MQTTAKIIIIIVVLIILIALAFVGYKMYTRVTGRYIKISQPNKGGFNLGELMVYSTFYGENIIKPDMKVTLSAQLSSRLSPEAEVKESLPSNLVDGNINTYTQTQGADAGWAMVDLGKDTDISEIVLYNRQDCCQARTIECVLTIFDSNNNVVYESNPLLGADGQNKYKDGNYGGFGLYTFTIPDKDAVGSDITK